MSVLFFDSVCSTIPGGTFKCFSLLKQNAFLLQNVGIIRWKNAFHSTTKITDSSVEETDMTQLITGNELKEGKGECQI